MKIGVQMMSYLSRSDIEKIATQVFNDYKHLPQFVDRQVDRVDPESSHVSFAASTLTISIYQKTG